MDSRMYETLTAVPLLQGMNGAELCQLLDRPYITIACVPKGEVMAQQGHTCHALTVLLSGTMAAAALSPGGDYTATARIQAPALLEPDAMYGIRREWGATYTAADTCRLMTISKQGLERLLATNQIFRINYLNALCTLAAKARRKQWPPAAPANEQRVAAFLAAHCLADRGQLAISGRLEDLGRHVGMTRSLLAAVLRRMQADGLLTVSRSLITVPDVARLNSLIA